MTVDMFVARKRNMRIDSVPDKSAATPAMYGCCGSFH